MGKILTEVKAFESRGGSRGAENSEYTYLVAAETNTQFHCPVCGNRVSSGVALLWCCSVMVLPVGGCLGS